MILSNPSKRFIAKEKIRLMRLGRKVGIIHLRMTPMGKKQWSIIIY